MNLRGSGGKAERKESDSGLTETRPAPPRAVLFGLVPKGPVSPDLLEELSGLCGSLGVEIAGTLVQVRPRPTPARYLGKGKVRELAELCEERNAGMAVCDEELTPVQARNLEKECGVRILDRSQIILSIFAERARSTQARLQVELAQREYELPRLRRMWTHLHRERGGLAAIGGMGEKQIEIDRRLQKKRIGVLKKRLAEIGQRRTREIRSRRDRFLVSLVGYTNAGKSSILESLTGAEGLSEDRLFSTLDTRTKTWDLGEGRRVLLSDTVGFIRKLPHKLVASFHATLAEAIEADLLLVVADVSDPEVVEKTEAVFDVLEDIGAGDREAVLVCNKVDLPGSREHLPLLEGGRAEILVVSARTGEGLTELQESVRRRLDAWAIETWIRIPHRLGALQSRISTLATVLEQEYDDQGARFRIRISPADLARLEARGAETMEGPGEGSS